MASPTMRSFLFAASTSAATCEATPITPFQTESSKILYRVRSDPHLMAHRGQWPRRHQPQVNLRRVRGGAGVLAGEAARARFCGWVVQLQHVAPRFLRDAPAGGQRAAATRQAATPPAGAIRPESAVDRCVALQKSHCSDLIYEVHTSRSQRCKVHRNHRNGVPRMAPSFIGDNGAFLCIPMKIGVKSEH